MSEIQDLKDKLIRVATHVINLIPRITKLEERAEKFEKVAQSLINDSAKIQEQIGKVQSEVSKVGDTKQTQNNEEILSRLKFLEEKSAKQEQTQLLATAHNELISNINREIESVSTEIADLRVEINPSHTPYIAFKKTGEFFGVTYPKGYSKLPTKHPSNFVTVTYGIATKEEAEEHYNEVRKLRGVELSEATEPELYKFSDEGFFFILANAEPGKELIVRSDILFSMEEVWLEITRLIGMYSDCKEIRPVLISSAVAPLFWVGNLHRKNV